MRKKSETEKQTNAEDGEEKQKWTLRKQIMAGAKNRVNYTKHVRGSRLGTHVKGSKQ